MNEITIIRYQANDGRVFNSKDDAVYHEELLEANAYMVKPWLQTRFIKSRDYIDRDKKQYLYDADPKCNHIIICGENGSGIQCLKCKGWYCG